MTRLDEIKQRLEAATQGEWGLTSEEPSFPVSVRTSCMPENGYTSEYICSFDHYRDERVPERRPNAALIAHAPADLRLLLAVVEAARKHYVATEHLYGHSTTGYVCDWCEMDLKEAPDECPESPYRESLDALDAALKPLVSE